MKTLSLCDAAYIAGLVDADGTVTLTRKHRGENRALVVSISNTDRILLAFVAGAIGAGKITRKRAARKKHSPSFVFAIYNRQALQLLENIALFLQTYKSHRADLILRQYVLLTPRNGRYTAASRESRLKFEQNVLRIKPDFGRDVFSRLTSGS
jgi:hypothetical protein